MSVSEYELHGVTTEPGERPYWEQIADWERSQADNQDASVQ